MGIFTDDELKAEGTGPETELVETDEQKAERQERERDEQGRFKAKEPAEEVVVPPEGEEGKDKGGTVPQQALHAEREKRKALEAEIGPLREQLSAIAKLREQVASRKPEDLPAADDPAALEHLRTRLAETEQQVTRVTQHMDDAALGQQELQQLGGYMQQSEARIRQEKPDYDAAIDHIVKARASELELYGLTPVRIQQTISEEAVEIIRTAVQQNRDPAELTYQLAQARGYRPAQGQEQPAAQQKPTGAAAMLDAIEKARNANKSLGTGGGAAVKTLTAEAVATLSAEEFEQIYSTPEGKAMIDAL